SLPLHLGWWEPSHLPVMAPMFVFQKCNPDGFLGCIEDATSVLIAKRISKHPSQTGHKGQQLPDG
ncbi:MAG: hypothetical protein PVH94_16920, partial [Desulfobacterales bacterium]